jgi:signal transduction histidine kinase
VSARRRSDWTELAHAFQAQAGELEKAYRELAASQERLIISEKMAGLGRLTAGIAHEINSPLGSVLNCLQLATVYAQEYRSSALDPEVKPEDHVAIAQDLIETLALAEEATRRIAEFVQTIKGQTRLDEDRAALFDPADEVDGTLLLLRHALTDTPITLALELQRGLRVRGNRSRFAVVVQNLVSNAVDAYESGRGTVWIRIFRSGDSAVLEVQDTGSGIPPDIRCRIYDYLFTTKGVGRGTGLGLSMVHDIVTSHFGGTIDCQSEVGEGTTFRITLPLAIETE